jgi:lipopolysaccharide transport system permease protein
MLLLVILLGCSLWMSALNVKYRDFRYLIPFVVQLGMYTSPVGFSSEIIPDHWRLLYSINPMVGIIDGFRWSVIPSTQFYWPGFILTIVFCFLILSSGIAYFRKVEKNFADIV